MPMPERDEDHEGFMRRCMMDDMEDEDQRRAVCESQWEDREGAKAMKYPHIANAVFNHPWVILPETLQTITALLQFRMEGQMLTKEEIQARIGAAQGRPPSRSGDIAVLPLVGVLSQRMNVMTEVSGGTSTEMFGRAFRQVMADDAVRAVVIDIHSPGGETFGVEELTSEISKARGQKPVIALANSLEIGRASCRERV